MENKNNEYNSMLETVKKIMNSKINEYSEEQKELIKKLENIEELKEERYKNYLKGFDEEFETHTQTRIKETPLLISLFNEFIQNIYRPSNLYWVATKTKSIIKEEILKSLNEEQKNLLEQLQQCEDRILDDMIEQAYVYGYSTAVTLRDEALKQYQPKENTKK